MINQLTVEGFKSLESVNIDLGQVNVFIGANGSGKSNLLEAVGVLGAAAFGRVDDEALLRRGVRPGEPKLYKSAFRHSYHRKKAHISFEAMSIEARYRVSLWNPLESPRPSWRFKHELLERGHCKIVGRSPADRTRWNPEQGYAALKVVELAQDDPAATLLDDLRSYCIYSANTPTLRELTPDQQTREPVGLSGGRLSEAVGELVGVLKHGADSRYWEIVSLIDWAKAFNSVPVSVSSGGSKKIVRFTDRYMTEKRRGLSAYDASEGALYVLFAAVLALHPRAPRCLAIDNLDQALNPRLAMRLAEQLCAWILGSRDGRQVLLTAHNPTVLDGLPLDDDRVRLFTIDRDNVGRSVVRRVQMTEKLKEKASDGWTLSRLWTGGLLGGVPNV